MFSQFNANYGDSKFPVVISNKSIKNFFFFLNSFNKKNILLFVDEIFKNKKMHPDSQFSMILKKYNMSYIKSGIKNKNINSLINICKIISKNNLPKDGIIVAIGGGVIGDIVSMSASIYKRGIKLVHLPTSMTAFVDSCIGGKTGINFENQVNLLGTYYQPEAIFIDTRFLKTLKKRDFKAGLVESIKKSIISNDNFYDFLNNNAVKIMKLEEEIIHELIVRSIKSKIFFSSGDIKEKFSRLFLNYGHTFGQALESYYGINQSKLTHGEAVSLGMMCAAKMNYQITKNKILFQKHEKILENFDLPTKYNHLKKLAKPNVQKLIGYLSNDKKKIFSGIRFIICEKIGRPYIYQTKNLTLIKKSFHQIL